MHPQIEVGYRMPAPTDTPVEMNGIMQACWQYDPEERPDFAALLKMLIEAHSKIKTWSTSFVILPHPPTQAPP